MQHTTTAKAAHWLVHHPWLCLAATALLVFAAGSGLRLLHFTTDYRAFFSQDNPQLQAFEALENTYTKNDNLLFLLAPKDGRVFTPDVLSVVQNLTRESWQVPYSLRVDSITNFQHTRADGDDLIVEDLVRNPASLTPEDLQRIRSIALAEPLLLHRLISPKADVTAVNVTIQLPGKHPQSEVPEVVRYGRRLADEIRRQHPDMDVYLTGMVMFNNAFAEASQNDMKTLVPISFAIILAGLALLLRGWTGSFATFCVIVLAVVSAMGLAGWTGIQLTPPSASSPTIILTLAVADAVHLLVTFFHNLRRGDNKQDAMAESLRVNLQPIFLTSLTTMVGFLSLNLSDAPPFRDLGNIVTMGVGVAFILSVILLPALMMILPVRVPTAHKTGTDVMQRFAEFVIRRRLVLRWTVGLALVTLLAFLPRNELNDVFVEYFDKSLPIRIASDFASERLSGLYQLHYSLESGESSGVSEPAYMATVEKFAAWFRQQPGVVHVLTYTDIMKRLNRNLHGDDDDWYRLPDDRELAAQYLLLYELSLPYGLDLNDQINIDKSASRMGLTLKTMSTNDLLSLEDRAQAWLRENAPPAMQSEGTGPTAMFAHIGYRNIRSMLLGTTLALVLISLVLSIAFRSVKIGLVSMIPNLAPAAMAFGLWGIFVGEIGLGISVVMGMTLGIVVDDTVHFLSKYLRARREKSMDPHDAVRYAFSTVGVALWITTLVLVAGFLVLSLSDFRLNADMGLLTAVTIALALAIDFLFLPPLLINLEERAARRSATGGLVRDSA